MVLDLSPYAHLSIPFSSLSLTKNPDRKGARHLIHSALSKVEGAYESYEDILNRNPSQSEPRAYEVRY